MVHHKLLRLSATLVLIGEVLVSVIAQFLHPGVGPTEAATFANFAASSDWAAVHLGQFVGTAALLAGLLVLYFALGETSGTPRWLGFFAATATAMALALAGVLYAVDGVANKQAEVAWVSAPAAEKVARFASAEAIRWLEWGAGSYHSFMQGLAQVLFALVIVWTARVPRPIGFLMGVSGLAFLVVGWVVGTTGYTSATTLPTGVGYGLLLISMIWLYFVAWLGKEPIQAAPS
jgi:hypothetical protein